MFNTPPRVQGRALTALKRQLMARNRTPNMRRYQVQVIDGGCGLYVVNTHGVPQLRDVACLFVDPEYGFCKYRTENPLFPWFPEAMLKPLDRLAPVNRGGEPIALQSMCAQFCAAVPAAPLSPEDIQASVRVAKAAEDWDTYVTAAARAFGHVLHVTRDTACHVTLDLPTGPLGSVIVWIGIHGSMPRATAEQAFDWAYIFDYATDAQLGEHMDTMRDYLRDFMDINVKQSVRGGSNQSDALGTAYARHLELDLLKPEDVEGFDRLALGLDDPPPGARPVSVRGFDAARVRAEVEANGYIVLPPETFGTDWPELVRRARQETYDMFGWAMYARHGLDVPPGTDRFRPMLGQDVAKDLTGDPHFMNSVLRLGLDGTPVRRKTAQGDGSLCPSASGMGPATVTNRLEATMRMSLDLARYMAAVYNQPRVWLVPDRSRMKPTVTKTTWTEIKRRLLKPHLDTVVRVSYDASLQDYLTRLRAGGVGAGAGAGAGAGVGGFGAPTDAPASKRHCRRGIDDDDPIEEFSD